MPPPNQLAQWLFGSRVASGDPGDMHYRPALGAPNALLPRWIFLRALGLIVFSAFYSLVFQIRGLIGPQGILPAVDYLQLVTRYASGHRLWFAPTLLWISPGNHMLLAICWAGMIAGIALLFNLWPRLSIFIAFICYLSFTAAAQDFAGYQSDGMLLQALFVAMFFAPRGLRPGLGINSPPSRASLFLMQWEWFCIFFESGIVKLLSGDPQWRGLTAMDDYYQNGPLPTWIAWYVAHLPHWFHAATTVATLIIEIVIVGALFLPRRFRIACFFIVTAWELGVILTANYTFLDYLVLSLGILLLDDIFLRELLNHRFIPKRLQIMVNSRIAAAASSHHRELISPDADPSPAAANRDADVIPLTDAESRAATLAVNRARARAAIESNRSPWPQRLAGFRLVSSAILLTLVFYSTAAQLLLMPWPWLPLPATPIAALEPFRIANRYGLFAVMTRGRYEIEFQGSNDGQTWTAYPFRYKPQAVNVAPGIYAPYQPRLDWNLWFASLGDWTQYPIIPAIETRLLDGTPDVLDLFAGNPFPQAPPKYVRAVLWQYWFSTPAEKRVTGDWWKRNELGLYAPVISRLPDGRIVAVQMPAPLPEHD
jgi:lipase maturation factor 1